MERGAGTRPDMEERPLTREDIVELLNAAGVSERLDLHGRNLQRIDLSGFRLVGANLREANLSEAQLKGANLNKTDLSMANLHEANLNVWCELKCCRPRPASFPYLGYSPWPMQAQPFARARLVSHAHALKGTLCSLAGDRTR